MASTALEIANMALARIGVKVAIASLTDANSVEAIACNRFYAQVRDELLAECDWPAGRVLADLATASSGVGTADEVDLVAPYSGWQHAYIVPVDCVAPWLLWQGGSRMPPAEQGIPFELIADQNGSKQGIILTDLAHPPNTTYYPRLRYTSNDVSVITNWAKWPATFVDALAWRLAAEIAVPLAVKPDVAKLAFDRAAVTLERAVSKAMNTGRQDLPPESELITVRG